MTLENAGYVLEGQISTTAGNDAQRVAILFDYIQDETSSVEADITDNWVESNYSLQDHIAIKPRMYRLRGCVGEVIYEDVYKVVNALEGFKNNHPVLAKTVDTLSNVTGLSGVVSNYTRAAMNVAKQIESSFDRYAKVWKNLTKRNQFVNKRQKAVYAMLAQMLQNRIPVKLTGLMFNLEAFAEGQYDKMYYLQSVSAHQGDSAYISDIEVTIKEFRIAVTKTTKVDKNKYAGMTAAQKTSEAVNGIAKGDPVPSETATKAIEKVESKAKTTAKEALKGHPMAYNAVKTLYNGFKNAQLGKTGFYAVGNK